MADGWKKIKRVTSILVDAGNFLCGEIIQNLLENVPHKEYNVYGTFCILL